MKKIILAYSGGLDTSVAIKWLQEKYGYEVIALAADVGEGKDLDFVKEKALRVGASKCYVVDAVDKFANEYIVPVLKANALYEGRYPLSAALSRPLISKLLVETAAREGAVAVAHGCTGKGNDQVRFDVSVGALDPSLEIVAPVREWPMSREEELDYAREKGIPVPVGKENPFSIDENLWGRSIECGVLEDAWVEPPEEAFLWTKSPKEAPDEPQYVEIEFEKGIPVALDGQRMSVAGIVEKLNRIGGVHGIGRVDHIENRLVGIKSREVYECPAATILIAAHRELEDMTLPREVVHYKYGVEQKYAELVYFGLWYSPLKEALDAFIDSTQKSVTGLVRLKLFKGNLVVAGRKSPYSLYDQKLATYTPEDTFDHTAAAGFINIWGLPTRVYSRVQKEQGKESLKVSGD